MSEIVLYLLHSTLLLSFYIDMVLTVFFSNGTKVQWNMINSMRTSGKGFANWYKIRSNSIFIVYIIRMSPLRKYLCYLMWTLLGLHMKYILNLCETYMKYTCITYVIFMKKNRVSKISYCQKNFILVQSKFNSYEKDMKCNWTSHEQVHRNISMRSILKWA